MLEQFDTDKDGKISAEEASKVTQIGVARKGIADLKGIEIFTELQELYCLYNQLTELDVSKNTQLVHLDCSGNQLTVLDVSKNTQLKALRCADNKLTALDATAIEVNILDCGAQKDERKLQLTLGNAHNRRIWNWTGKHKPNNRNVIAKDEDE